MSNLCELCGSTMARSKYNRNEMYCTNYKKGCKYKCKVDQVQRIVHGNEIPVSPLSDEQQKVVDACNYDNHIFVEALAGTGKTYNLVQCVRVLSQELGFSVLCLAFAKRDKDSLTDRVCGRAVVKTSNGAGWNILSDYARSHGKRLPNTDGNIPWSILWNRFKSEGLISEKDGKQTCEVKGSTQHGIIQIVDKVRQVIPLSSTGKRVPTDQDYEDVMTRFGIEVETDELPFVYSWATWLFNEMASLNNLLVYGTDWTGQLFLPSYHNLQAKQKFQRILVDEVQDQSYVTRRIIELHIEQNGRIIAVGDRNQAIYTWRGADKGSMDEMKKLMYNMGGKIEPRSLTLNRRCAKSIIREAQKLVPQIKALDDAPEGEVVHIQTDNEFLDELKRERKGLVLCRSNAPSVGMCLKLLAEGIPAAMVRSDIVGQLLRLIEKLGENDMIITDFISELNKWGEEQYAKFAKRPDGASKAQIVADKIATLNALSQADEVRLVEDLKIKIDELFPTQLMNDKGEMQYAEHMTMEERSNNTVLFSTVHGAKGGEANTVYLYSPSENKSCLWDLVWSDASDRDNTLYVALTRGKNKMVYVGKKPLLQRMSDMEE